MEPVISNDIINGFYNCKTIYEDISKLYNKAINSVDLVQSEIKNLTKSQIYKASSLWTWDSTDITRRNLFLLQDVTESRNFGSDRNIFLYNLNDLDVETKRNITTLYYEYYSFILNEGSPRIVSTSRNGSENNMEIPQFEKFKAVSLCFSVEVLLCLGSEGTLQTEMVNKSGSDIRRVINNFASKSIKNSQLTDQMVVKQNREYNKQIQQKIFEGGLDSFTNTEFINPSSTGSFSTGTRVSRPVRPRSESPSRRPRSESPPPRRFSDRLGRLDRLSRKTRPQRPTTIGGNTETTDVDDSVLLYGGTQTDGTFEFTTQQATYPLLSYILLNPIWYKTMYVEIVNQNGKDSVNTTPEESSAFSEYINQLKENGIEEAFEDVSTAKNGRDGYDENVSMEDSTNETNDIFLDENICFHPLIPIYMITQAYFNTINNENITESVDSDLFINYYSFLIELARSIVNIYSDNTSKNKLIAYCVGLGMKEILFTSNNTPEGYHKCLEIFEVGDEQYSNVSSLTHLLSNSIIGTPEQDEDDIRFGKIFLDNGLIKKITQSIKISEIFSNTYDYEIFDYNIFKSDVLGFLDGLEKIIIQGRGGDYDDGSQNPVETETIEDNVQEPVQEENMGENIEENIGENIEENEDNVQEENMGIDENGNDNVAEGIKRKAKVEEEEKPIFKKPAFSNRDYTNERPLQPFERPLATFGGFSRKNKKRHPTIRSKVKQYKNKKTYKRNTIKQKKIYKRTRKHHN